MKKINPIRRAKRVLELEAKAITGLTKKLDRNFERAIDTISGCKGKIVITGIGKSGLICQKIAATLASTGTPAVFLHAAEGFHGDLGVLTRQDVVIAVSNSGETEELNRILPIIKRMGIPLIAITGTPDSTLGRHGDIVINAGVEEEACPMILVPTASTTAALAMGDALAVVLLEKRGFKEQDFAMLHPGGTLGKRLLYRVEDLMHSGDEIPLVRQGTNLKGAIFEITAKRLGVTGVLDANENLVGVITDGDLRRGLEKGADLLDRKVDEIMTPHPKRILRDELAARAMERMEHFSITSLFVVTKSDERKVEGIIHVHDLLRAGIA